MAKSRRCSTILYLMILTVILLSGILLGNIGVAILKMVPTTNQTNNNLNWDSSQQANILGMAYLGSASSRILGGRLSEVFGPRKVIGISLLLCTILTLSTPLTSSLGYYFMIGNRLLIGIFSGIFPPALMPLCSRWFSSKHNGKFSLNILALVSSVVLSFALNGYILSVLGWPFVFYVNAGICLLCLILWAFTVFDSPEQHPWISEEEKEYVLKATAENAFSREKTRFKDIPWLKILSSRPVWAIVISHMAYHGTAHVMASMMPRFFTQYFFEDINNASFYVGIPGIGHFLLGIMFSTILEKPLRKCLQNNITLLRRIFQAQALFLPAVFMLCEIFLGDTVTLALTFYTLALSFNGAVVAGHMPNSLDISPNFSGTIFGIASTFSSLTVYGLINLSMFLVGNGHMLGGWHWVFWIFFAEYLIGGIVFMVFSSAEVQSWNEIPPQ